uniref:Uncharacterized protein n=1 Tax=Caenorhabditis japonica TaxID=281687 RepID=A0A8R1DKA6_CAEJA
MLSFTIRSGAHASRMTPAVSMTIRRLDPLEAKMAQKKFNDILGTSDWTLRVFKKNPYLTGRVINGFVNAYRFLDQETDEKTNTERMDDEDFGQGPRTRWERMIDHEFDEFYSSSSESSS